MKVYFALLAALAALAAAPLCAQDKTIYGVDNRLDFFQVTDPVARTAMDSAVSVFRSTRLAAEGGSFRVDGRPLGSESRGLCPGQRFFEQNTAAYCSGTLIAPDLVLTAGHCMQAKENFPDACAAARFGFGYAVLKAGEQPGSLAREDVYSCAALALYAKSGDEDYAVVRLDRPVSGHRAAAVSFSYARPGAGIFTVGGPYGLPLKVTGGSKIRSNDGSRVSTDLDTSGGNSGGGVFDAATGAIIALHVASADPDLIEVPLPDGHGLPATDKRVIEGKCKVTARFPQNGGDGKRAVVISSIPGLRELLSGEGARGVEPATDNFRLQPAPEEVSRVNSLLR